MMLTITLNGSIAQRRFYSLLPTEVKLERDTSSRLGETVHDVLLMMTMTMALFIKLIFKNRWFSNLRNFGQESVKYERMSFQIIFRQQNHDRIKLGCMQINLTICFHQKHCHKQQLDNNIYIITYNCCDNILL